MIAELLALHLIKVTGAGGEAIEINPSEIVSVREPGQIKEHLHPSVKCVVFTADAKFVTARETCQAIHNLLEQQQ